jgi:conjugal transfer pilus assembly protein TraK
MSVDLMASRLAALIIGLAVTSVVHADGDPNAVPAQRTATRAQAKPAPRDAKEVRPDAAIRATAPAAIDLPGVMRIEGADAGALDPTRARVIPFSNGVSRVVWMSATQVNRIQLPFANPRVIGVEELDIDRSAGSNNLFVSFRSRAAAKEARIYIEAANGQAIALDLVPKDIPGQTILVEDSAGIVSGDALRSQPTLAPSTYEVSLADAIEAAVKGSAPGGYSVLDLRSDKGVGPIVMSGLLIEPALKFSGRDRDIYVYDVSNPTQQTVTLTEEEFNGAGVLALSIHPAPQLAPGARTRVYVVARRVQGGVR